VDVDYVNRMVEVTDNFCRTLSERLGEPVSWKKDLDFDDPSEWYGFKIYINDKPTSSSIAFKYVMNHDLQAYNELLEFTYRKLKN
jgi:hypothetical protein